MRKTVTALFLLFVLLMNALPIHAEGLGLQTETGSNGEITYPISDDMRVNEWLHARLGVSDALILLQGGAEITGRTEVFVFSWPDGGKMASVAFTQAGKIRFGRYGQVTNTILLDQETGAEIPLEALFVSMETAQTALNDYVQTQVLPQLNTYLDTSDVLPVPMEQVSLSSQGMTFHYPSDRFSFFSGNSGAVEVKYHEILDILSEDAQAALLLKTAEAQEIFAAASAGWLYGIPELRIDMPLHATLNEYGMLSEPDYIPDDEIYEMEAPRYRGVQLLAVRGAEYDEGALITGVRASRLNMWGVVTGETTRTAVHESLGAPLGSVLLDASAAESYRVTEGWFDSYAAGEYMLKLYYDLSDTLAAVEIGR